MSLMRPAPPSVTPPKLSSRPHLSYICCVALASGTTCPPPAEALPWRPWLLDPDLDLPGPPPPHKRASGQPLVGGGVRVQTKGLAPLSRGGGAAGPGPCM